MESDLELQSSYPGLQNYDELRFLMLRYRFQEHAFLGVQWKAMQRAGVYYKAPKYRYQTDRVFESPNDLQQQLDACGLLPLYSNLQDEETTATTSSSGETLQALRYNVCYQMQLLLEASGATGSTSRSSSEPTAAATTRPSDSATKRPRRSSTATTTTTTATMERGADLYLSRKKRPPKRKQMATTASPAMTMTPSLFTIPQTIQLAEQLSCDNSGLIPPPQEERYEKDLSLWRHLLSTNHNLVLYGHGSKTKLLQRFEAELRQEGHVLTINGYDKDCNHSKLLTLLVDLFLDGEQPMVPETSDRATEIGSALAVKCQETNVPIFLLIQSLDGGSLSSKASLEALCKMVPSKTESVPAVRLVVSVDHVDSLVLASEPLLNRFVWKPVHTYRLYSQELQCIPEQKLSSSMRKKQRLSQQAERVLTVLRNLAPRYGEVMQILAKLQLSAKGGAVDYKIFRSACKTNFVIDKEAKLRHLLTELKDHGLLETSIVGNTELVQIPYNETKLREIRDFAFDQK